VEIAAALTADLGILTAALDEPGADVADSLRQLAADATVAIPTFLGLSVTADGSDPPFTFTTLVRGVGADDVRTSLRLALPGIGPWTAEVIAMRGLGDPDAFPASDLGLQLAAKQLGLPTDQRILIEHSARWRPWRSYATQHLWTTLEHPVNQWPPQEVA